MESDGRYKVLFYAGSGWNFAVAGALLIVTNSLPALIGIEPPRYPIFIHFNLMSIFFFGCMQWIIARDLHAHRGFVKLLVGAKLGMVGIFVATALFGSLPNALTDFLAPGMIVDTLFGLGFLRFVMKSRSKTA